MGGLRVEIGELCDGGVGVCVCGIVFCSAGRWEACLRAPFLAISSNLDKPWRPDHIHDVSYASATLRGFPGDPRVLPSGTGGVPPVLSGLYPGVTGDSKKRYRRVVRDA